MPPWETPAYENSIVLLRPDGSIYKSDLVQGDEPLRLLPQASAVYLITAGDSRPLLARTALLQRRALRLLERRATPSRLLNLRDSFERLDYWRTGSSLDDAMIMYELARVHFPDDYQRVLRLRFPPYVKLLLRNPWPRSMITTRLGGKGSVLYGPFRNRATAESFETEFLDLFAIRRCLEDLKPSQEHPGCLYGELNKCLRPCQCAVSREEYGKEVEHAESFLRTDGESLLTSIRSARDQLSAEMEFEAAARQHQRLEKVEDTLKLRDELAGDVDHLQSLAITRSAVPNHATLHFVRDGNWQGLIHLGLALDDEKPASPDRKVREALLEVPALRICPLEREERLAILARWFYSTWRDGELLRFDQWADPPVRKIVNAIGRVMEGA